MVIRHAVFQEVTAVPGDRSPWLKKKQTVMLLADGRAYFMSQLEFNLNLSFPFSHLFLLNTLN